LYLSFIYCEAPVIDYMFNSRTMYANALLITIYAIFLFWAFCDRNDPYCAVELQENCKPVIKYSFPPSNSNQRDNGTTPVNNTYTHKMETWHCTAVGSQCICHYGHSKNENSLYGTPGNIIFVCYLRDKSTLQTKE
jgi:hypothetical protein